MSRFTLLLIGAVALLIAVVLVMTGTLPVGATASAWAPWVGFGGAILLFILAIRSRSF